MNVSSGAAGYDFSDDPLSGAGFGPGDETIRVRPGPVRTTLIRPPPEFVGPLRSNLMPRLIDLDGHVFNDPRMAHHFAPPVNQGLWIQNFYTFFSLRRKLDPFHLDPDGPKRFVYEFERAINGKTMHLKELEDTIVLEGLADGQTLDRAHVEDVILRMIGPEVELKADDVGPVSITLQFVPTTWHLNKPSDPWTVQVQAQYQVNILTHKNAKQQDVLTVDFSMQAQASFVYDNRTGQVTNFGWMDGGQLSSTQKGVLLDFIDLQEFAQLLSGVTFELDNPSSPPSKAELDAKIRSKTVDSKVSSVLQGAVGFQINFNLTKNMILFVQFQTSLTGSRNSHDATLTLDGVPFSFGLQVTF